MKIKDFPNFSVKSNEIIGDNPPSPKNLIFKLKTSEENALFDPY